MSPCCRYSLRRTSASARERSSDRSETSITSAGVVSILPLPPRMRSPAQVSRASRSPHQDVAPDPVPRDVNQSGDDAGGRGLALVLFDIVGLMVTLCRSRSGQRTAFAFAPNSRSTFRGFRDTFTATPTRNLLRPTLFQPDLALPLEQRHVVGHRQAFERHEQHWHTRSSRHHFLCPTTNCCVSPTPNENVN